MSVIADFAAYLTGFAKDPLHSWVPWPAQQRAIDCKAFELLWGGSAGGGKTDLVLYTARLHHRSSLILRRTYPELEDTIIKRILERDQSHYNSSKHIWMPDPGRRVRLGSCELEKDAYKYLGGEYDLFAPDELTQFTETQYLQILSRVRSTDRGQRCRVLATTNPGGENEAWVLRRWGPWLDKNHPDRAEDGEVRWYKRGHGDEDVRCESDDPDGESRSFIQARLADNPALAGDGKYRRALMQLPEVRRRQLLDGDWTAGSSDVERQVIPTEWIKAAMGRWSPGGAGLGPVTAVGVDVARGGRDRTVLAPRWGNWFGEILSYPGSATTTGDELADLVMPLVTDDKGRLHGYVAVDGIGVGSSAYDTLRGRGVEAWAVMAGSTTNDGERFFDRARVQRLFNMRAAVWWNLREALDPEKGDGVQLPFDPELLADLQAPRYLDKGGGVALEPKDKIRERIGRSPDKGDAVAMALYPRFGTTGAVAVPMRQRAPIAVVQSASVMRTGGVGAVRWGAF